MTVLHTILAEGGGDRRPAGSGCLAARVAGDFENLKKRSNFEVRREFILWKKI